MAKFLSLLVMTVMLSIITGCGSDTGDVQTSASGLSSQTREGGGVTVVVTPQSLGETGLWSFRVVLDTHSVDLSQDPAQVSVLVADGKEYQPETWEGDPPGGHHRTGILKFTGVSPRPKQIELRISEVGGIERSFAWAIE